MPVIRIEWVPIKVAHLGVFGFDHLQLVFDHQRPGPPGQDDWFVIEGLKGKVLLGVGGTDGVTTLSAANGFLKGADLVSAIGTPLTRGSKILPLEPFTSWFTMAGLGAQIDKEFTYSVLGIPGTVRPTCNSTSVLTTLLHAVGLDITQHLPVGMRTTSGLNTLLGTRGADEMTATFPLNTIFTGRGNDTIRGSTGPDKLYGGLGDDVIYYSRGFNIIHGGQYGMEYKGDGTDIVDYSGAGRIEITKGHVGISNATPDFIVYTPNSGNDHLFSIERIRWLDTSDQIILRGGVELIEDRLFLKMGGQDSGTGDHIDFSEVTEALYIAPTTNTEQLFVRAKSATDPENGTWLESTEWLVGTRGDDEIYITTGVRGVEGGDGDDLIDARLVQAFSGGSPGGYDVEIDGGAGADKIIANAGRTRLVGGSGADQFIISEFTGDAGRVEIVIENADAEDRLLVPHNFFNGTGGGFEGSALLPVLGGIGDIQQTGPDRFALFDWLNQDHYWYGTDLTTGVIRFIGAIEYNLEGTDLLIHLYKGVATEEVVEIDDTGATRTFVFNDVRRDKETLVRVKNFAPGQLGIDFYKHDEGRTKQLPTGSVIDYPNHDQIVAQITNGGNLLRPLQTTLEVAGEWTPEDPGGSLPLLEGSSEDDTIDLRVSNVRNRVSAGDGDDTVLTGAGSDSLDGGSGSDTLEGGAGDDTYYVDSAGDRVVEQSGGGDDKLYSDIDITAPDNIETLYLAGEARIAHGNAGDNSIAGNEFDNTLAGEAGDDILVGSTGDDVLSGGTGGDTYFYTAGDGFDTIRDEGDGIGIDTIEFNTGILPADITLWRMEARPDDLLLELPDGGRIVIEDFALETGAIERIVFGDGSSWTEHQFAVVIAAAEWRGNDAPVAAADLSYIVQGNHSVIGAAAFLANDRDYDGDVMRILSVESGDVATVSLDAVGNVVFDVPLGYEGPATFRYTVTDDSGGESTADVEIMVMPAPALGQVIEGSAGGDTLSGDSGDDVISGLGGNDRLNGLGGDDELDGGDGADRLAGGEGDDTLTGGRGRDTLDGGGGNDTLDGTDGGSAKLPDTLIGGEGDDVYISDGDLIVERAGEGYDTVVTSSSLTLKSTQEIEVLVASGPGVRLVTGNSLGQTLLVSENATAELRGMGGNDLLSGNSGANRMLGGTGDDRLEGLGGDDLLYGQDGADTAFGGDGNDRISGGAGDDRLFGDAGNDLLFGDAGDDRLFGGSGSDTLRGGAGDDILEGGEGDDLLLGEAGADAYVFAGAFGQDEIRGFRAGDILDLTAFAIGYGDLRFTLVTGGLEVRSAAFGDDDSILLSGVTQPLGEASFRLAAASV